MCNGVMELFSRGNGVAKCVNVGTGDYAVDPHVMSSKVQTELAETVH